MTPSRTETRAKLHSPGGWGTYGSQNEHQRYSTPLPPRLRNRGRCPCYCGGKKTHAGMANGLALMSGCALSVRRWVREPKAEIARWWAARDAALKDPQ